MLFACSSQNLSYKLYSIDYKNDSDWRPIKTLEGFILANNKEIALVADPSDKRKIIVVKSNNEYQYVALPKGISAYDLIINTTSDAETFVLFASSRFFTLEFK